MALALGMFALRHLVPANKWPDKLAKTSFWSLNIGLAWNYEIGRASCRERV